MTILTGAFRDIAGKMAQGTVTLVSQVTRPAHSSAGQVVTEERHVIRLVDGAFVSPELDPGPIRVELSVSGAGDNFEVFEISLPEDGRHDLADLIDLTVDWSPGVIGRVEAAAADANRAAQAAGLSATRAADAEHRVSLVVASAADVVRGELQVQIDGAMQARVDAQAAQAAAEAAALTVVDDARTQVAALVDELEVSFSDAQELVSTASGHAEASAGHAEAAAGSAAAARESADAAGASAAVVGDAVGGAEQSAQAAATSATTAAGHAATAQQAVGEVQQAGQAALTGLQDHVTTAEGHATAAGVARTGAETARDEAVAAAESATTGAPADGWQRAALHQDVQDSLSRADTAMQSMPRATGLAPGGVTLAGDLGGTADAPTVPGLAAKVNSSDVSEAAIGQSVPRRTQTGTIRVSTPTSDDDAASKQYVDHQVATAVPPTTGPSEEEMTILWDAVQRQDPIEINLASSPQSDLKDALTARGLDYRTITYPAFSVALTGTGPANYLFQNWARMKRAPVVTGGGVVTNMSDMFSGCAVLTDIPAMDTSQVTNMGDMFSGCAVLTDIPAMDTSQVTNMGGMFSGCSSLTSVPDLDTSQVTNMRGMFSGCSSLTSVPDLDTSQVTNMSNFALRCSSLEALSLDIPAATSIGWIARECPSLESLVLTSCGAVSDIGTSFTYGSTALGSVILDGLGLGLTWKQTLDMKATKLDAAAANALMESLGTVPADAEGSTLALPTTAAGADTTIATAKNWQVTIG